MNKWTSRLNFILATTGAAVGLGAIWKFPYMAGTNGGSAFVLLYIFFTLVIGLPIMIGEIVIGKNAKANPVKALGNLGDTKWKILGIWGSFALILILSFYSVVAGWSLAYMTKTWGGAFANITAEEINILWINFLSSPIQLLLWHSIFMFSTLWVVARGIQKGLEMASNIMMPGLFIVLAVLMVYSCIIGDSRATLNYLLHPDFTKINFSVAIDALGQAIFTLATGAGCMLVYGSYAPDDTNIINSSCLITLLVILVSIMSGFAIFPLVFAFDIPPSSGPSLMFQSLPLAFSNMAYGSLFGGMFFLMLWFAAWTSSISLAEPLVLIAHEQLDWTRRKSAIIVGSICWLLGALAMLSFNLLQEVKIFGKYTIFSAITDFATNIMLPIGALGYAVFAGWILKVNYVSLGWKCISISLRYIVPLAILIILTC